MGRLELERRTVVDLPGHGFNGSLARCGDGFVYVDRCGGIFTEDRVRLRFAALDRAMRPVSAAVEFARTRELDPRIIPWRDGYLILSSDGARMYMRELAMEGGAPQLAERIGLTIDNHPMSATEKNWSPFVHDERLHAIYGVAPHVILEVLVDGRCHSAHATPYPFAWPYGFISGGTPAIRIGDEYLTFFHSFMSARPGDFLVPRQYYAGAYTFRSRPPFDVTRATTEPLVWDGQFSAEYPFCPHDVVFPSGLVVEGDRVILSHGENDGWTVVLETRLQYVLAHLRSVGS